MLESRPEDRDLDERLDELIPLSAGPIKTLVASAAVVGAAIASTVLIMGGYLYPRPTFGSSFSSGSFLEVGPARNAVSATVMMPNNSSRSVRITDIAFDGPGADVVDVGVILDPPYETQTSDVGVESSVATPILPRNQAAMPLPIVVPAGRTATVVVWFRPTDCIDKPGPWGLVDATVDFGDGAFPPFSNTVSLHQDPVAFIDLDGNADNGGESMMMQDADGSMREISGPLAGACEALR
jgi:hypothetical protein